MRLGRDVRVIVKKAIIFLVVAFMASLIQTSFLAVIEPFGAVPDLVLLMSLGAGFFWGPKTGGAFGVIAGAVSYAVGGVGFAYQPLFYALIGVAVGIFVENFFMGKYTVWVLYVFCVSAVKSGLSLAYVILFSERLQLFPAMWRTVIAEFFATLVLGMIFYVPIKKICKFFA